MAAISPAPHTQRSHREKKRASASHSECSECSESSKKRPPTAPPSEHTHLESPCRRAAAPRKPNFHQHAAHEPPSALSASSKMARISAWYRRAYLSPREVADHHTPGAVLPPDFFVLNDLFYVLFFFFLKIFSPAIDFSFFMCYICINI